MSIIIKSGASSDTATVGPTSKALRGEIYDAAGNQVAPAEGTDTPTTQGALITGGLDDGVALPFRIGKAGSLGIAQGQVLFWEDFESTTVNTARWLATNTTMTVTQAATGLTLNASAITTVSTVACFNSARRFERRINQPLDVSIRARVSAVTNSVIELGLGDTTSGTTAIVNNGAFFRAAGTNMTPVIAYNGTEVTGSNIDLSTFGTVYLDYGIAVDDFSVVFVIRNSVNGNVVNRQRLLFPNTQAKAFATTRLPLMFRVYNGGSAPASAPVFIVGSVTVLRLDDASATPWSDSLAGIGSGGEAFATSGQQTANYSNSAAPSSFTLSNTAAGAGTFGGQWQFAAVAGAETDYAFFAVTIPTPYSFMCTGVHISSMNTGAAVATTASVLQWSISVNSTAVSLATTTTAPTSQAHNRVTLGLQSFAIGAAVGSTVPDLDVQFRTPLFCGSNRVLALILKCPIGTATASQIIRGTAMINGYFI